jgi:hypothetical protein
MKTKDISSVSEIPINLKAKGIANTKRVVNYKVISPTLSIALEYGLQITRTVR